MPARLERSATARSEIVIGNSFLHLARGGQSFRLRKFTHDVYRKYLRLLPRWPMGIRASRINQDEFFLKSRAYGSAPTLDTLPFHALLPCRSSHCRNCSRAGIFGPALFSRRKRARCRKNAGILQSRLALHAGRSSRTDHGARLCRRPPLAAADGGAELLNGADHATAWPTKNPGTA